MKITSGEEAQAVVGNRIRYVEEGHADTNRIKEDTIFAVEKAPYRLTVEGEVTSWTATPGERRDWDFQLHIAGYGEVDAEKAEVLVEATP